MSAWKLVEAVPDVQEAPQFAPQPVVEREHHDRSRPQRPRRNHQNNHNGRSKQERSYYAFQATLQIDNIFHPDSLCMDTYLRSYMDVEGFVPIALVCTYQNVAYFQCSYEDIVNKLMHVEAKAKYYELDLQNETIRPRTGWEMFRMPNGFGDYGLPKYIKQQQYYDASGYYGGDASAEAAPALTTTEGVPPAAGNN